MSVLPTVSVLLLVGLASAERLGEDRPLVNILKETIYQADLLIAQNHLDVLPMPDIGLFPWDPLKMRHGKLLDFSSMELQGDPDVDSVETPGGGMVVTFDLAVGLRKVGIHYDFSITNWFHTKAGNASILSNKTTAQVQGTYVIGDDRKCEARLHSVQVVEFGHFDITIDPDDLPGLTAVNQLIVDFISPKFLPLINKLVNGVVDTALFKKAFSDFACQQFPL